MWCSDVTIRALRNIASAAVAALTWAGGSVQAADIAVIMSARAPVPGLTSAQLADIYLGRTNRLPDGTPVQPCDLPEGLPLRDEFYNRVVGKSSAQVKAYWSKLIFTGRGRPPREASSSQDAKRLVAENPGLLCYIDRSQVDGTVTVVHAVGEQR